MTVPDMAENEDKRLAVQSSGPDSFTGLVRETLETVVPPAGGAGYSRAENRNGSMSTSGEGVGVDCMEGLTSFGCGPAGTIAQLNESV